MSYPTRTPAGPSGMYASPSTQNTAYTRPYIPQPTSTPVNRGGRPPNSVRAARQAQAQAQGSNLIPNASRPAVGRPPAGGRGMHSASPAPIPQNQPPAIFYRPAVLPEGPLPLYVPCPGQPTLDSTLTQPPRSQAMYSTYPSRIKSGVTALLQPETITGGPREREAFMAEFERDMASNKVTGGSGSGNSTPARFDSPVPTGGGARSGRRGRQINYAELEESSSESEPSEVDEPPSDPEDTSYAGGARGKRRGYDDMQSQARVGRLKKKKDEMDKGWTWLGERAPAERVRSTPVIAKRRDHQPEEILLAASTIPESLLPISLDLEISSTDSTPGYRLKDRFLWNINEPFLTPRRFAEMLVSDLAINNAYIDTITDLINSQIEEGQAVCEIDVLDKETGEEEIDWAEVQQAEAEEEREKDGDEGSVDAVEDGQAVRENDDEAPALAVPTDGANATTPNGDKVPSEEPDAEQEEAEAVKEWKEADQRVIINLDVQIYTHILRDRIEWDLSSPLPPVLFSSAYCRELGLSGEAIPLVAHAITEEILKHKKDALDWQLFKSTHPAEQAKWEHPHGAARPKIAAKVNAKHGSEGLKGVWRDYWEREEYGPILVELGWEEMERREMERVREARRTLRGVVGKRRRL